MTSDEKQQHKLLSQAANGRLVHLNEQLIFPLLDKRIHERLEKLCQDLRATGAVLVADVAYISACKDLAAELDAIAKNGDRAFAKL